MAFPLSNLLNPVPASGAVMAGAREEDKADMPTIPPSTDAFAPELFQSNDDAPIAQIDLATMASDAASALEVAEQDDCRQGSTAEETPQFKQEITDATNGFDASEYPAEALLEQDENMVDEEEEEGQETDSWPTLKKQPSSASRKMKTTSPESTAKAAAAEKERQAKPSKHSSKNEGQHTDRRYLCYICSKLFTRRRSVRDHISKIHGTKTWEPVRSLEVIVDPATGEPPEPLEDIIARGPPPPPPKAEKGHRAGKLNKIEETAKEEEADVPAAEPEALDVSEALQALPAVAISKIEPLVTGSRVSSVEPFAAPAPVIGKKRPAPDSAKPLSAATTKKGMAKIKNTSTPNKKPKLAESDTISEKSTTFRSPSATPASVQRTPASKLKKQTTAATFVSSPTPTSSRAGSLEPASPSPSVSATPGSSNDDGEIFCICRKGDNHTWMIACDGGCDEWFHGNCVNIRERDGDLIDKYVCPNCKKEGFHTTWKRMCRRKGCRKPAKVLQDPPSKYCSKECGRMFFVELIRRGDPYIDTMKNGQYVVEGGRAKKMRKVRKRSDKVEKVPKAIPMVNGDIGELVNGDSRLATPAYSEEEKSVYETDSSADDDQLPNRGGALRAGEVKAIIDKCKTIEQWKELGRKPATPPRDGDDMEETRVHFDDFETAKLGDLKQQSEELNLRNEILDARETFLGLVKTRSTAISDGVKKSNPKMKDPCGFDPRLAWSEEEFLHWYNVDGKTILESGKVGPPDDDDRMQNGQPTMMNGMDQSESEDEGEKMPKKGGVCVRNRCPRHRNWAKGQLAEIRFEQDVVRRRLRKCEVQERETRDRAVVKAWETR